MTSVGNQERVNESSPENFKYRPVFFGDILEKSQTSLNFNFITSRFPENFLRLPIPGETFRFSDEFCFSPETGLLRVDTPRWRTQTQPLEQGRQMINLLPEFSIRMKQING